MTLLVSTQGCHLVQEQRKQEEVDADDVADGSADSLRLILLN